MTLDNRTISDEMSAFIDKFDSIVLVAFGGYLIAPMPLLVEIAEVSRHLKGKVGFVFAVPTGHRAHDEI